MFNSQRPMNLMLVHQNFPGQFRHLAMHWAKRPDVRLMMLGASHSPGVRGLPHLRYRKPSGTRDCHPYLQQMDKAVRTGQATTETYLKLKRKGYRPDVVLAHPGWGDTLYLKEVFPDVRLIHFCEWYYNTLGADVGFDPEFEHGLDANARITTWNALHALNLNLCDEGVCPTVWQRSVHPEIYQPKLHTLHEGVPTRSLFPDPEAHCPLPNGQVVRAGEPVITYVARNLEPYRGIHSFLRALAIVQKRHRTCQALIVGGDGVSYGRPPKDAPNWRIKLTRELSLDSERTHFLGQQTYEGYCRVLRVSAAHVYLTYPFVLSWSLLEAMASGCLIIGSDTAPVREVVRHGENGWLVDFFNIEAIAERIQSVLENPVDQQLLRGQARSDSLAKYGVEQGIEGYNDLLGLPSMAGFCMLGNEQV